MPRWAFALVLASSWGCGGSLDGAVRTLAVTHISEWEPTERFLECERDEVQIEAMPALVVWSGQRRYWFRAALPVDSLIDPETGNLLALPPALPDYFIASCGSAARVCYWHEVLLTCSGERCEVIADNWADEGMLDCSAY